MRKGTLGALYLLYVAALGVIYAAWPGSPDQYELDYLGWRLLSGDAPYVDWIDVNWPGIVWLHQLSVALFGNTLHGWRILDFALMLGALSFLVDLLRRMWGPLSGAWGAILYPPLYATAHGPWFSGQPDLVAAHLLFPALWCHWRAWETGRARLQVGTGLAVLAAVLVKPVAAPVLPLLALHGLLMAEPNRRWRTAARHALVSGLGVLAGLALALALLRVQGATLEAIWEVAIVANLPARRPTAESTLFVRTAWRTHAYSWHWIAFGAVLSLGYTLARARGARALARASLLPLLWAAGWIAYAVQNQGFPYHLGIVFAAMLSVLFSGLGMLSARVSSRRSLAVRLLAVALLCVPVFGTAIKLANAHAASLRWLLGFESSEVHYARFPAGDDLTVAQAVRLADTAMATVPEGEPVLVWGTAAIVNFIAERPQPTRFYYAPILWSLGLSEPVAERWRRWLREDLEARPPQLCVIPRDEIGPAKLGVELSALLEDFLTRGYERTGELGSVDLYRRIPHAR